MGKFIHDDKYVNNHFREELVDVSADLISEWLHDKLDHICVAYIPLLSKPELVKSFAYRVVKKLNIQCLDVLEKTKKTRPQKELENSAYQFQNAFNGFSVIGDCTNLDILLIDDNDSYAMLLLCSDLALRNTDNNAKAYLYYSGQILLSG